MNNWITFYKTVQGKLHIDNDRPCEDFSGAYEEDNEAYSIAVVADGHGMDACFRSKKGSEFAVKAAIDVLKETAENIFEYSEDGVRFYNDLQNNEIYRQSFRDDLVGRILGKWNDAVTNDLEENPVSDEELSSYDNIYEDRQRLNHIYGTTLIAVLRLPKCYILLQQGDGRCVVFYKDGAIDQPIPWDEDCEANVTTSLCDSNSFESFRVHFILSRVNDKENNVSNSEMVVSLPENEECENSQNDNADSKTIGVCNPKSDFGLQTHSCDDVIACLMGSDGVEDAYPDSSDNVDSDSYMAGVNTFYKDVICNAVENSEDFFNNWLEDMLPEFSANGRFSSCGSGDDVSVAGIININECRQKVKGYQLDIEKYKLSGELTIRKNKLKSMNRKREVLQKKIQKAQEDVETLKVKLEKAHAGTEDIKRNIESNSFTIGKLIEIIKLGFEGAIDYLGFTLGKDSGVAYWEAEVAKVEGEFNKKKKELEDLEAESKGYNSKYESIINEAQEVYDSIASLK